MVSESKFPACSISSRAMKGALLENLIEPIVERHCVVYAYRIIWRHEDERLVGPSWNRIVPQRLECDQIVKAREGVSFFISSITAVFNKANKKGASRPKLIFPAISYWVVSDADNFDHDGLMQALETVCYDAQIKHLTSLSLPLRLKEDMGASLCIALKDHNGGFIKQKIDASASACYGSYSTPYSTMPEPPSKIVVKDSNFAGFLQENIIKLKQARIGLVLEDDTLMTEIKTNFNLF